MLRECPACLSYSSGGRGTFFVAVYLPSGSPLLMSITSHGAVALAKYTTATRPTAAAVGEGAIIYDDTLNLPIVSDGTTWRNFSGTAV